MEYILINHKQRAQWVSRRKKWANNVHQNSSCVPFPCLAVQFKVNKCQWPVSKILSLEQQAIKRSDRHQIKSVMQPEFFLTKERA